MPPLHPPNHFQYQHSQPQNHMHSYQPSQATNIFANTQHPLGPPFGYTLSNVEIAIYKEANQPVGALQLVLKCKNSFDEVSHSYSTSRKPEGLLSTIKSFIRLIFKRCDDLFYASALQCDILGVKVVNTTSFEKTHRFWKTHRFKTHRAPPPSYLQLASVARIPAFGTKSADSINVRFSFL